MCRILKLLIWMTAQTTESGGKSDVWIPTNASTATKLLGILEECGFGNAGATHEQKSYR